MSRLAVITYLDGRGDTVDPGYGVPGFSGNRPDNSLPVAPVYPSQPLPGGGHISLLPVYPFDPTIDNSLPDAPPPDASTKPIVPGRKYVVKWLACSGLILVPDNTLPETPTAEPK